MPAQNQLPQLVQVSAEGDWDQGLKTSIQVRQFQPFHTDEPREFGGTDSAPNPMEYVMGALCGCEAVMINMVAREMGFKLEDLQVQSTGTIDTRGLMGQPGVRRHFQEVRQTIRIKTNESQDRLNQLRQQVESRCPAYNLLKDAGVTPQATWEMYQ